jgi:hypothetical protein
MASTDHAKHCFIAIPSGRTPEEKMFYEGWLNEVILPAMPDGYEAIPAASTMEPTSITTDIFEHLLLDPVAIFDLGGSSAEGFANPNVMYELGIRHAFRLPSVILAWDKQPLPFDIGDQRAVKIDRHPYHFKQARMLIREFVMAAADGKFYDPLESLANRAVLERAATAGDGAMQAIAEELRGLRTSVDALHAEQAANLSPRDQLFFEVLRRQPDVVAGSGKTDVAAVAALAALRKAAAEVKGDG